MKEEGFLFEMQRLALEMDKTIDRYGVRDKAITLMVTGVFEDTDDDHIRIKAIYSYNIQTEEELENIVNFVEDTWTKPDDDEDDIDLTGLLDGTGIFLN